MSALIFELLDPPGRSLDLADLNPASLAGKSLDAIRRLRLLYGRRRKALGDLFKVSGDASSELAILGVNRHCHQIGQGMADGILVVHGHAGDGLGREMSGGQIRVKGDAGDGVGAGMTGGCITLTGSIGDRAGGFVPGATRGMNEGLIRVGKSAGARTGERMRRGFIVIAEDAGAHTGERMIGGTIVVLGQCGVHPGFGMRRGTLLLAKAPTSMTPTFNDCGEFELAIIAILKNYIASHDRRLKRRLERFTRAHRWCGDMSYGGKGEILIASDN